MKKSIISNYLLKFTNLLFGKVFVFLAIFVFSATSTAFPQEISIPNFWDPNERFIKPATTKLGNIRFITTTDFPPFSFVRGEKQISGFHVDLARAICSELGMLSACQIQALPWSEHESAMAKDADTVLISGLSIDATSRQKYAFTRTYLNLPGRFVGRKTNPVREPLYHNLSGKVVGFVSGTAHEAFLVSNFGRSYLQAFLDQDAALKALKNKKVDVVFSDSLLVSFWLHSKQSDNCCEFTGGPYLSSDYFGKGLAIAVNSKNKELLRALNFALRAVNDKGAFSELYLRYFPESLY
jgi:polar amino acid transport system substrate-binding protein